MPTTTQLEGKGRDGHLNAGEISGNPELKVALLSGGSSIHTIRWANGLSNAGVDVLLITQHDLLEQVVPAVRIRRLPHSGELGYFRNVPALRKILAAEKPDVLNAHYASGYGTTARLAGFQPLLLSVWGSDVYDFPEKSILHRWLLRKNLMAATKVASTSHAMAAQTRRIVPELGEIAITPFGVDTDYFVHGLAAVSSPDAPIVIGTVKVLKDKYGIDTLIDSMAVLVARLRRFGHDTVPPVKLRIVGDGPQMGELKGRASHNGIGGLVEFVGRVPHEKVPDELRKLDIYVALSRLDSESFGVAIIEASACSLPVVVSDVGGLPEVVDDGVTGIVVPRENAEAAAVALERLVLDQQLRQTMGAAGRKRVANLYDWHQNVRQMISVYEDVVRESKRAG